MRRLAACGLFALLLGACVQPEMVRNGVRMSYETAAEVDLNAARRDIQAQKYKEARTALERFERELPRSTRMDEALFLLGGVHEKLGERELAAASWRRLVERHPDSRFQAEAALRAAQIYRELGRPDAGLAVLSRAKVGSVDAAMRMRVHRLRADLARETGDYAHATFALAYVRRDASDPDVILEVDLELEELIESRLVEEQLADLSGKLPSGPVHDRVLLVLASRAMARGDRETAREALERLPAALRPADELMRERLLSRIDRGSGRVEQTLGLAIPLSGPYAAFGKSVLRGTVLGLGLYDDPDARFRVIVRDTAGEVERGRAAVEDLVAEGVAGIIGPLRSSVAEAAAPIVQEAAVPLLTLARREDVSLLGEYVFRMGLTVSDEARALASYAIERRDRRRIAILYPDDEYGRAFKNVFWGEVESLGGMIVGSESYAPDAVDWQEQIKKLVGLYYLSADEKRRVKERQRLLKQPAKNAEKLADPRLRGLPPHVDFDALLIPDHASKAGLILPQLRFYDVRDVTYLGGSGWNDPSLVTIAGREARRAVFIDAFHPVSNSPRVSAFSENYIETYGDSPDALAAEGFDAAALFLELIDGSVTREGLREKLLATRDFNGVSGLTEFDETGGTRKQVRYLTVRDGAIQPLDGVE